MATIISFGVPSLFFVAGLCVCNYFSLHARTAGLWWFWGCWGVFTGAIFFGMHNAPGWDVLVYFFAAVGISAPLALGGLIGGLTGAMKRNNADIE